MILVHLNPDNTASWVREIRALGRDTARRMGQVNLPHEHALGPVRFRSDVSGLFWGGSA